MLIITLPFMNRPNKSKSAILAFVSVVFAFIKQSLDMWPHSEMNAFDQILGKIWRELKVSYVVWIRYTRANSA